MSKNLFDERNDLENVSLEDLLKQEEEQQQISKTEKLKKVSTKTFNLTKKVAANVKDKADEVYKEKKAEYNYNKANGIDNFDDKLKKNMNGYGLAATFAKRQMNRNLLSVLKEEEQEKGQTLTYFIRGFLYNLLGFKGLIFYYIALLIGLLLAIEVLRAGVIMLIPLYLLFKYISVHIKYTKNAKFFDFKWYLDLIKLEEGYRGTNAKNTYLVIPSTLFNIDNELEDYLEKRGKGMRSGQREYASISNSKVIYDERYGYVRIFEISNVFFRKSVNDSNGLQSVELNDYYLIPQQNNGNEYTTDVYYQVHSQVHQCIAPLLDQMSRDEFIDLVISDDSINYAFPEIAEQIQQQKEADALALQAQREAEELEQLQYQIASKGLSNEVATIIKKIRDNVDVWNFNIWNGNDNMSGNTSYFKVRCVLRNKKSVADVETKKNTIEAELRRKIMIKPRQDRGAFDLVILLNENLNMYSMTMKDLEKYNSNNKMFIGNSLTGPLSSKWNFQANHFMVGGFTGSGKSVEILNILAQLVNISKFSDDFDYSTMFLTSSSKIGDFAEFDKAGALVVSGIDKQIQVFQYILSELERREALFYEEGVQNIKEYNKKFPNQKMKQLVLLADEYENTRQDLDKKKAQEAEGLIAQILNIARSSGGVVITGSQSILKGAVGVIRDKMTIKVSGFNEKNVLNQLDTEIAGYYQTITREPQGVFFYNALNLKPTEDYLTFGNTSFTLIQTPYISDISKKTLGGLHGAEFKNEIFGSNSDLEPKITEVKEEEILDLFD